MRKYLTKKGYEKLMKELRRLKNEEVPRLSREINEARALGDLSENAEYHAAKEDLTNVQKRIAQIQNTIGSVVIIDETQMSSDKVYLGALVEVEDATGERFEYTVVSEEEADPVEGRISSTSPIGSALIGKSVGDEVEFRVPAGLRKIKIVSIRRE
ncbi:MAG: transcription elongation factor GreA [Elusimicrobia bacterium]|nr:transcription elongation factor GreA [Elusimicrobiota bacterium]